MMNAFMMTIAAMMQTADLGAIPQTRSDAPLPGQRQTREDAAPNIAPMNRLPVRIESRIDMRIQNRISRSSADMTASYKKAADESRGTR